MFEDGSRDASAIGRRGGLPLKLTIALGAAMLMLCLAAGTGGTKFALAYNVGPAAQPTHVMADFCGYNGWNGWNGFYAGNGSVFAPYNNGYFYGNGPWYDNCYSAGYP